MSVGMSVPRRVCVSSASAVPRRRGRGNGRRPTRAHEAAPWRVAQALVAIDADRAATPQAWVEAVAAHPEFSTLRKDARLAVERMAVLLAGASERGSLLVRRLTWERMAEHLGCTTRSVARLLRRLHDARLLGRVAGGVSARFIPLAERSQTKEGEGHSAVYVLAVPAARDARAVDAGDGSVTPSHLTVSSNNPSRTRVTGAREAAAVEAVRAARTCGRALVGRSDRRMVEALPSAHREAFWDGRRTPVTRVEMLAAAAEMGRRSFVLRRASRRAVRSAARDFWAAGWSVADVLHALDYKPDGSRWPHSGADRVRSVHGWMRHRLAAWRAQSGTPLESRSAHIERQREADEAARAAEQRERQEARARAVNNPPTAATRRLVAAARAAVCDAARRRPHPLPKAA